MHTSLAIGFYHLLLLVHLVPILTASSQSKTYLQYLVPQTSSNLQNVNLTQDPPVLTSGDEKRVIVHPRDNVELTCPISCDPGCRFHWTKGNESIEQWDRFHFPKESKAQLQIRALKHEDSGTYECLGVNGFGSTLAKLQLVVQGDDPSESNLIKRTPMEGSPPKILIHLLPLQSLVTLSKGDNRSFHCEATGYPRPNITWYKNNLYLLGSSNNVGVLELSNVTETDGGSYRCEAENEFQKSIYKVRLEVEVTGTGGGGNYPTAKILSLTPANLTLFPGENGSLTCVVRSNASISFPVLFWVKRLQSPSDSVKAYYHKGELIEMLNLTEVIQKSANTYSTSLVFNNVSRGRAGTYVCAVEGPLDDFEYLEANLFVPIDTASVESSRRKAAQVQWTLLLTFCFVVISLLAILAFARLYRMYGCRKKTPKLVTRSPPKQNGVHRVVAIPAKSPAGETVSTTLSHQNEIYERFIQEPEEIVHHPYCHGWNSGSSSRQSRDTTTRHCPTSSRRKRFHRQRRLEEFSISESSSQSDWVYAAPFNYRRGQGKSTDPTRHVFHGKPPPPTELNEFRLHQIPYENQGPPCTPAYSLNNSSS